MSGESKLPSLWEYEHECLRWALRQSHEHRKMQLGVVLGSVAATVAVALWRREPVLGLIAYGLVGGLGGWLTLLLMHLFAAPARLYGKLKSEKGAVELELARLQEAEEEETATERRAFVVDRLEKYAHAFSQVESHELRTMLLDGLRHFLTSSIGDYYATECLDGWLRRDVAVAGIPIMFVRQIQDGKAEIKQSFRSSAFKDKKLDYAHR